MGNIQFEADYAYNESYIPPRCRKPRIREVHGPCTVSIPTITSDKAPVAMRHQHCWFPEIWEYRWFNQQLYRRSPYSSYYARAEGWYPLEELKKRFRKRYFSPYEIKEDAAGGIQACQEEADRYLIINGDEVWEVVGEPRYVIVTFGLGHNHASTALMIDNFYNSNIRGDFYFSALERKKAVERCVEVALARGDTNSVEDIRDSWPIEVLIPEAVRCNPAKEAGPGNEFLNSLESLIECSDSQAEAAALVIIGAASKNL